MLDVSEYCRDLETYLCQKNDGHLIRIVGPSFEVVSRWAASGVPFKVARSGIDRYFERYYRKGPRRRPVRIEFCEADVLDVFDEWRRATGVAIAAPDGSAGRSGEPATLRKRGPSLPEHLERVVIRLSSLRVTGALGDAADPLIDKVSAELDAARSRSGGVRGDERRAVIERLALLDDELITTVRAAAGEEAVSAWTAEAGEELAAYRATMPSDAFDRALTLATNRLIRERVGLPVISFS
jgi:hypothetical protein